MQETINNLKDENNSLNTANNNDISPDIYNDNSKWSQTQTPG